MCQRLGGGNYYFIELMIEKTYLDKEYKVSIYRDWSKQEDSQLTKVLQGVN